MDSYFQLRVLDVKILRPSLLLLILVKGTQCTQGLNGIQTHGLRKCISAAQCSTNSAMKTNTLGTGQFVEFILTNERNKMKNKDDVNCGNILVLKYLVFKDFSTSVIVVFKFHHVNVIMHHIEIKCHSFIQI